MLRIYTNNNINNNNTMLYVLLIWHTHTYTHTYRYAYIERYLFHTANEKKKGKKKYIKCHKCARVKWHKKGKENKRVTDDYWNSIDVYIYISIYIYMRVYVDTHVSIYKKMKIIGLLL